MHRFPLIVALLVMSCNKSPPQQGSPQGATEQGSPLGTSQRVAENALASSSPTPSSVAPKVWYVGTWKGDFAVARRSSATTAKEGAPAAWEKDAGQVLTGAVTAELNIDALGEATGSLKGALGDLGLVGKVDAATLQANLVARSDDPKAIQNGYLLLTHDAGALKGRLDAATGDALLLRQGEVTLRRVEP